ncbi:MAG TPA: NUDIX hydrolase [Thermosynechococcaceae cyanobacterium]
MGNLKRHEVAIAILYRGNKFLMQLRDDVPGILYPGHWALFGGHIEPGEHPDAAVRRELLEEISYSPPVLTKFCCEEGEIATRHVYYGRLEVELVALVLGEGWDMALVTPEEIRRGDRYSSQANQVRPMGPPHQRLLLQFLEEQSRLDADV